MSTDISIADIVIHLHPNVSDSCKGEIDKNLRARDGVVSVHFNEELHPFALVVGYNPRTIDSQTLLAEVRKCDKEAVMASL